MTDISYGQSRSWAGKITSPKSRAAAGRLLGAAGLVALAYYAGARIGFALTLKPSPVSTLWPPNSILLAAFLLTPSGCWWALVLGAFVAHLAVQLQSGIPLPMVLGWFVSNSSEALIGAGIIRHFIKGPLHFESFRQVGVFVVGAALIGNFVSSFLDAGFVSLVGWGRAGYWDVWVTRTASNALASLTLVPVIVTWAMSNRSRVRALPRSRYVEAGVLAAGLFAACILAFGGRSAGTVGAPTLLGTGRASVSLQDAYIRWTHDSLALQIGQFKTPFSREFGTSLAEIETADRATVVDSLAPKRDIGIMASYAVGGRATISAGIFNGEGQNITANSDSSVLGVARVTYRPAPFLVLGANASRYFSDSTRYGVDAGVETRWIILRGEYLRQHRDGLGSEDDKGWYGLAAAPVRPWLQPAFKYERFDRPGIAPGNQKNRAWTAAVNLFPWGRSTRLTLEYVSRKVGEPGVRRRMGLAQAQVIF
jgi:hypothetical protein